MKGEEDIEEAVEVYEETVEGKGESKVNKQAIRERLRALYWVLEQKEKEISLEPPMEEEDGHDSEERNCENCVEYEICSVVAGPEVMNAEGCPYFRTSQNGKKTKSEVDNNG